MKNKHLSISFSFLPKLAAVLLLLCPIQKNHAQGFYQFQRADEIPVTVQSVLLPNAWTGGMNFVQANSVDLDFDGKKDLVFFDRSGFRVLPFLNQGNSGDVNYRYAPEYRSAFPLMREWMIMRDYNGDGKMDIFTYSTGGAAVYKNTGSAGAGLSFQLMNNLLTSNTGMITQSIFITSDDIPGITDVDGDGDIDICTFNNLGRCVQFHRNMSQELYGNSDSLRFRLQSDNWGNFSEGISSNAVVLNDSCDVLKSDKADGASTFLIIDLNGDGLVECVLGDANYNNLISLKNGGTPVGADFTSFDSQFPANNLSTSAVNLTIFPAAFYEDVDNDGKRDLVVSPQGVNRSENKQSVWWYRNQGSDAFPDLKFVENNLLQKEMIDLGEGAYPVFFDYDGDGLQDLFISNHGYFISLLSYSTRIALFRNTGTASAPEFTLVNDNFANLSGAGLQSITPTFGDLDGDGDKDMIIGEKNGKLHFYRNIAASGQPAQFTLAEANFEGIQTQQYNAPFLFDMNKDGKLDLIVGNIRGWVDYYQNNGSSSVPEFPATPTIAKIGGISVVDSSVSLNGFSTPVAIEDGNDIHIFVGSYSGRVSHYRNVIWNLNGTFERVTNSLGGITREGLRTAPAIAYLDDDNKWDLVLGNYAGGVSAFRGTVFNTSLQESGSITQLLPYPNPASDMVTIPLDPHSGGTLNITDMAGKTVSTQRFVAGAPLQFSVQHLAPGLYTLCWQGNSGKLNGNGKLWVVH